MKQVPICNGVPLQIFFHGLVAYQIYISRKSRLRLCPFFLLLIGG